MRTEEVTHDECRAARYSTQVTLAIWKYLSQLQGLARRIVLECWTESMSENMST